MTSTLARRPLKERVRASHPASGRRQERAAAQVGGFEPGTSEFRARADRRRVERQDDERQLGQRDPEAAGREQHARQKE
jgi:hypothetical protein